MLRALRSDDRNASSLQISGATEKEREREKKKKKEDSIRDREIALTRPLNLSTMCLLRSRTTSRRHKREVGFAPLALARTLLSFLAAAVAHKPGRPLSPNFVSSDGAHVSGFPNPFAPVMLRAPTNGDTPVRRVSQTFLSFYLFPSSSSSSSSTSNLGAHLRKFGSQN